ncbi:hypothetical protein [Saccharibacillus brassicae]|nr:hypothetical protein [Saccharibacillus brassicae]
MLETKSSAELAQIAADTALDYDIRIAAQTEIYRRQRPPEGTKDAKSKNE